MGLCQSLADAERRHLEVVRRIEARLASDADRLLAEVDLAERRQALASLGHSKHLIVTQLAALLDLEAVTPERFVLELQPIASDALLLADGNFTLLVEEAWRQRPEPRALNEQDHSLNARGRLAGVQRLPRLDLAAQAQLVDPKNAKSQRDSAQAMIAAATEGYRVRFALFQAAAATATELAEAETRLAAARLALVDAELGIRVGLARLDHALGRPL